MQEAGGKIRQDKQRVQHVAVMAAMLTRLACLVLRMRTKLKGSGAAGTEASSKTIMVSLQVEQK